MTKQITRRSAIRTMGALAVGTAELAGIMARTGVRDLKHFDPAVIHKRNF